MAFRARRYLGYSIREWNALPGAEQYIYVVGMNEHLKQEAKMTAMASGAQMRDGNIQEGNGTSRDSVPVDGDITDLISSR